VIVIKVPPSYQSALVTSPEELRLVLVATRLAETPYMEYCL